MISFYVDLAEHSVLYIDDPFRKYLYFKKPVIVNRVMSQVEPGLLHLRIQRTLQTDSKKAKYLTRRVFPLDPSGRMVGIPDMKRALQIQVDRCCMTVFYFREFFCKNG